MEASSGNIGGGIQASLGGRYAFALFEMARDGRSIDAVENSLAAVREALVSRSSPKASTRPPVREMRGPRNRVAESIILRRCEATVLVDPDPMQ